MELVIATLCDEDVSEQVDDAVLEYIEDNGLMDAVVSYATKWMRGWYDDSSGDAVWSAVDAALRKCIGDGKMEELRGE